MLEAEADHARGAGGARSRPGGGASVLQRKRVTATLNQRVISLDTRDPQFAEHLVQALAGLTLVEKLNALAQLDRVISGPNPDLDDLRASEAVRVLRHEVETTEMARLPMSELLALAAPWLPRGTIKVIGGVISIGVDDRTSPEYLQIVEFLRAARLQGVNLSALYELADVFFCATDGVPLVATGDWGIIEGLGLVMGIPMGQRKPHVPFSEFLRRTIGATSFIVELKCQRTRRIQLCPIDSVQGPVLPDETTVAKLARSGRTLNPQFTLERGMIVFLPNRIGKADSWGYFMGYDDVGRVRVAIPALSRVETLSEDEPIDPATGGRRGPEPERRCMAGRAGSSA